MSHKLSVLIFAVLCILAGALTQASDFGHRPPHVHGPMFPPHVIGRPPHVIGRPPHVIGRPPHSHTESPLVPSDTVEPRVLSDAEDRPPHINEESPLGPFNSEGRPPYIHDHSPLGPSDAEGRPPHIQRPIFPPHVIGRPPHSHEDMAQVPAEAEYRPPHFHDKAPPPIPHDWPFEYSFHDESPMLSIDAESLVPSDAVEPRVLSDAEDRPSHINEESPLGPFNSEGRPPHIHDHSPLGPSDAEGRPPHIHRPIFPPHTIGRPPHSHEDLAPVPAEAEYRPPHFHDKAPPPIPHDWPFEYNFHDESSMLSIDAESPVVPSDAVEPRVLSDAEDRPSHSNDESPLGPSDAERRLSHIHRPKFPPLIIGRPPHSHEETSPIPAEAEDRTFHIHDEAAPMPSIDAESLISSDAVEPRVLSDAEDRPAHFDDQSPLGPFNSEGRPPHIHDQPPLEPLKPESKPPHIHDDPHVPYDKPFQHTIPDWGHIGYWVQWTSCDIDDGPRVRCQDCRTKLICTRLGGFVFENRDGSYCNDGLWSDVPSEKCV